MASGSFSLTRTGSTSSYANFTVNWSSTSNGSSANSSTLNVAVYVSKSTSSTADTYGSATTSVSVTSAGTQTESGLSFRVKPGGSTLLFSKSFTVPHADDGSKSVTISVDVGGNVIYANGSKTVTLDTIPRQATLASAPNFTDEDNPTITYSNPAGSAATVQTCIANTNGNIQYAKYRDVSSTGSSYTFSLTDEERAALIAATPEGKSEVYVRFYIKTYIDGSLVGDLRYLQRKFSVINTEPELTTTVTDTGSYSNQLTNDQNTMIRGLNYITASMSYTLKKGATILSQSISHADQTIEGSSAIFENVEDNKFIFSITDSFGNTVTEESYMYMVEYIKLTCNIKVNKPTADGDLVFKISGNYFNGKFSEVGVDNTLTLQWRIKAGNEEYDEWISVTPTITDNTYEATVNVTGLNYKTIYTVQAMASDLISTGGISSSEYSVVSSPVFNWGENNFDINVPLTVDNIICNNIFSGQLEQGSYDSNTGEDQENATCYRSADMFEAEAYTSYQILVNDVSQKFVVLFYDVNKTFIGETRDVGDDGIFTTVENTKYINFRCFQADYIEDFASLNVQVVKMSPIKTKTINGNCIYGSGNMAVSPSPVILYESSEGTTGNVTLLDSAANYKWLEIHYKDYDNLYGSAIVFNNMSSTLFSYVISTNNNAAYPKGNKITVSGTTITRGTNCEFEVNESGATFKTSNNNTVYTNFHILRVIGYTDSGVSFTNADEVSY